MVPDFRVIRPQGSPHIPHSPNFYFFERARYAGHMGLDLGRTQRQHFQGDLHQQRPLPHPHFQGDHRQQSPLPHHRPVNLPHSHDMREVIHREIEKEQIRQEIIMSEIVRRRELEAEVRRELMMERELALRRGSNGFPFGSPSLIGFDSSTRLPLVEARAEGRSMEERMMLSLAERDRLRGRHESGGIEPFPFQRGSADVRTSERGFEPLPFQQGSADVRASKGGSDPLPFQRRSADVRVLEGGSEPLPFQRGSVEISQVKPVSLGGKEKEKIILLSKPKENVSGVKREASGVDAGESPLDGDLRKKAKEDWSCPICQVHATSERGLNEHLQGKKHKLKEAALRAKKSGKNYSIGLLPKKAAKAVQAGDPGTDNEVKLTSESLPSNETGKGTSRTDDLPLLHENLKSNYMEKNEESGVAQKVQKKNKPKNEKCRFWCELCQVGVASQRVMNNHLNGKKHKRRLQWSNKNGGVGPSDEKEGAADEPVDETTTEDAGAIDEAVDETLAEDVKAVKEPVDETLVHGRAEPVDDILVVYGQAVDEILAEDCGAVDVSVDGTPAKDGAAVDVIKPDDGLTKADVANERKHDELPVC